MARGGGQDQSEGEVTDLAATSTELKCPHCGAKVGRSWTTCWLCGLELPATLAETPPGLPTSTAVPSGPKVVAMIGKVAGLFLAVAIGLVLIGMLANGDYGGVIAYTVLLLPAGIVTLTKSIRHRAEGTELSTMEKVSTFLMSLAVTVGVLFALGIAMFVALCIACFAAIGSGQNLFR